MSETQQRQLQRRGRRYERHSRWERLWNRVWAYKVGSPKHFFVACMDLIIGQDWWVSPAVGSAVLALSGGIARLIGGRFLTGVLVAATLLVAFMVASGWVRFRREVQGIWTWPPGSGGPEEAGVREPRRPPPGGGEMSTALELDHDDSV
ncbi:MAG: hypothetical protein OEM81_11035 [Acidimicrobiia bacterium]|nr:hypothetical protein [Acidimicrobiia bacterium]MDH3398349.1 hypothetical protein [Acidimicrobiia bacterium]